LFLQSNEPGIGVGGLGVVVVVVDGVGGLGVVVIVVVVVGVVGVVGVAHCGGRFAGAFMASTTARVSTKGVP